MSSVSSIRIGLCGFGTVGQGVWKHLQAVRQSLDSRMGVRLEIARVAVRDRSRPRGVVVPQELLTEDPLAVATDPSIAIVCELIGGTTLARDVTMASLKAGKIVVSANKALLSECGAEIFGEARRHGGHFLFEASVAGGIPIVKALREGLVANRFPLVYGILNGTCNYILSRMAADGAGYKDVLSEAKRLGYAEADESLDVEGWDTAHKAAVLTYLAHGVWVKPSEMIVDGITRLNQTDFRMAEQLGYVIKLLAVIARDFEANELNVRVHPTLLSKDRIVASVNGVFNAVSVSGDVVGTTTYIGRGAGQDATASAVISDIVDAAALLTSSNSARRADGAAISQQEGNTIAAKLAPLGHIRGRFYLRMTVRDEPGVLAQIASVTAQNHVSIERVIQTSSEHPAAASLIITTHESDESSMSHALTDIARLTCVLEPPLLLRIGDFE